MMRNLAFIELAVLVMAGLNVLMVVLTVGVKAVRTARLAWYRRHFKRIVPALENYIITGEDQRELDTLRPWKRALFASRLIAEHLVLIRGSGKEDLMRLADHLGLVDRYLKELGSRRRWRRARAADNLGYFGGERSVPPLGDLLADPDETVRAVAARALARVGTQDAAEFLAKTLNDPSELTRLRMAENLDCIGPLAVKPLMDTLENGEPRARVFAARVLGNLRAAEARPPLRQAMLEGSLTDLRAQATLALGKIGDPDDVHALLSASDDEEWPVRAQVANAMGMIGDVSTIPTLQRMMTDHEWWVRLNASRALANMGSAGESALVEVLEDPDLFARQRAAATLEARGVTRRLVGQLDAPNTKGERARRTVRALITAGATKQLRRLARSMPDGGNRRVLQEMLEEAGEP
jgi:HEAT repeat protein